MKQQRSAALLGGIVLSLSALVLYIGCFLTPRWKIVEKNTDGLLDRAFSFGVPAGLYEEDLTLYPETNVIGLQNAEIRYTLDGTEPTQDSLLCDGSIRLEAPEVGLTAFPVKAKVYQNGQELGGTYETTYFLSSDASVFKDVLLVSITSEPDGLFSPERGILYPAKTLGGMSSAGITWDEFLAQNCCQTGPEWIREAHVDIFEGTGNQVISQNCGLSVSGFYGSLTHYPFSLNIKADVAYEQGKNRFYYDFFKEKNSTASNRYYYNKISLKNGGNDFNYMGARDDVFGCMLRNIVCSELAAECGLTVSPERVAIVYLNGQFYNVAFVVAAVNEQSIAAMTGLPHREVDVQKLGEEPCMGALHLKSAYSPDEIFWKRDRFDATIDMKELMRYYAFECMIGNTDWPGHNYALWNYTGEPISGNPHSTNKYRPFLFDLDCSYHLQDPNTESWDQLFDDPRKEASLLNTLLLVDDYRNLFVNEWVSMYQSEIFSEQHIFSVIDEKDALVAPWFHWMYGDETEAVRQQNILYFKNYVHEHRQHIADEIAKRFGVDANSYR